MRVALLFALLFAAASAGCLGPRDEWPSYDDADAILEGNFEPGASQNKRAHQVPVPEGA